MALDWMEVDQGPIASAKVLTIKHLRIGNYVSSECAAHFQDPEEEWKTVMKQLAQD